MRHFLRVLGAWAWQFLHALTQIANTMIPPLDGTVGWADESMSARAYRARRDGRVLGWLAVVINWFFFWQDDHCKAAYLSEHTRRLTAPEHRSKP
ncbi:MAG: hypothetical protein ACKOF9_04335 [Burkholderiales bacterium]